MTTVKINLDGNSAGRLEIDGHEIADQTARIWLAAIPGKQPELKVQLVQGLLVDGPADIRLTTNTRNALIALGWTPPQEPE